MYADVGIQRIAASDGLRDYPVPAQRSQVDLTQATMHQCGGLRKARGCIRSIAAVRDVKTGPEKSGLVLH